LRVGRAPGAGYEIVCGFLVATPVILPPPRRVRSADVAPVMLKSHLSRSIQSTGAAMTTCVNRPVSSSTTTISISVFYGRSFRTSVWGYQESHLTDVAIVLSDAQRFDIHRDSSGLVDDNGVARSGR
jgi:hypothetical protein